MSIPTLADYATHSAFSHPGTHAAALAEVSTDPASLHAFVADAVVHYYAGVPTLSPRQLADVDHRWVSAILDAAVERAPGRPLGAGRALQDKVGGCCRDHSLLAVSVLREHAVPARTRLGFAGYLGEGFHTDHVVAERYDGDRWVRFDPEIDPSDHDFDVHDIPAGEGSPLLTAAEAWTAYRAGRYDPALFGARLGAPGLTGPGFLQRYVLGDLAHRHRCELLLWDTWGAMTMFGAEPDEATVALTDEVAALTTSADAGDHDAEEALARLWQDDRVHPGRYVMTWSPTRRLGSTDLHARSTSWAALPPVPQGSSGSM